MILLNCLIQAMFFPFYRLICLNRRAVQLCSHCNTFCCSQTQSPLCVLICCLCWAWPMPFAICRFLGSVIAMISWVSWSRSSVRQDGPRDSTSRSRALSIFHHDLINLLHFTSGFHEHVANPQFARIATPYPVQPNSWSSSCDTGGFGSCRFSSILIPNIYPTLPQIMHYY